MTQNVLGREHVGIKYVASRFEPDRVFTARLGNTSAILSSGITPERGRLFAAVETKMPFPYLSRVSYVDKKDRDLFRPLDGFRNVEKSARAVSRFFFVRLPHLGFGSF